MISMVKSRRNCQAVPDRDTGVVVGTDVSKGKLDFGAFRPDQQSKVYSVKQDQAGFSKFSSFVSQLKADGCRPWIAFEPTGPYSTCFREMLLASDERVVQVNGYHVKRTKEVRDNSPKKDDTKDPRVIADLVWLGMLELIERRQEQLTLEMQQVLESLPEAVCLLSVWGIGTITVAGLLGECGDIGAYKCFEQLEKFVGLNLYEVSSGQHKGSRRISKRGRALARYLICTIAVSQCKGQGLFRDYAVSLKTKGKTKGQIRVAVARKMLKLLYAIARDRAAFDPQQFRTGARTEDGLSIQQETQARQAA